MTILERDPLRQGHVTMIVTSFGISCSNDARTMIFFFCFCRFCGVEDRKINVNSSTVDTQGDLVEGHVTG